LKRKTKLRKGVEVKDQEEQAKLTKVARQDRPDYGGCKGKEKGGRTNTQGGGGKKSPKSPEGERKV